MEKYSEIVSNLFQHRFKRTPFKLKQMRRFDNESTERFMNGVVGTLVGNTFDRIVFDLRMYLNVFEGPAKSYISLNVLNCTGQARRFVPSTLNWNVEEFRAFYPNFTSYSKLERVQIALDCGH